MQTFSQFAVAALLFGSSLVNGHMVMKSPKPFGTPNNSPLDPSGSDFPCKGGPYDRSSAQNVMPVGSTQTLSFTGSAVHGGGSCQVALTTDLEPTASSKWMVIKSIEGGCPASVSGNLPEDPNGSGASSFQYTIPQGIEPGEYVIAWSWINKIGNREFYMNCGPATITGAQKKRYVPSGVSLARRQSSFPDLFVANIASVNDCTTPESFDYNYPNPGDDVEQAGAGPYTALACGAGGSNPAPKPSGGAGAGSGTQPSSAPGAGPTGGAGAGSGAGSGAGNGAPTGAPSQPGAAQPTGSAPGGGAGNGGGFGAGSGSGSGSGSGAGNGEGAQGGSPTVAPGNFATGAAPLPSGVGSGSGADSAASGAAAPTGAASAPAPPASTGTGSTGPSTGSSGASEQSGPCTEEGTWTCSSDGSTYQRCASGQWSVAMQMAQGMKCTPGTSVNIAMAASAKSKRAPRRL